ncbi:alpha/beta fold hydrolase [Proteocatella sphenisci]|uniref:alpha/beta fold hydrolase n=1 Tax=Proteocatella sphenisci TaxID=181070 RepID=UPI00048B5C71|nr:alpha/beta hydrolase [Proteocatella sphenisci]
MDYSEFDFKSYTDDVRITCYKFMPESKAKAIIQMSHGMSEKALRYTPVIESLVSEGFGVYINDHRGHGKSAHKKFGYMGEGDVFLKMVRDMRSLNHILTRENPGVPVVLLGHSMGSFLSQRYIQIYPETVDMLLLSGSNGKNQIPVSKAGKIVARIMMIALGTEKEADFIRDAQDLFFNKKIRNRKTKSDWLTTKQSEVGRYEQSNDMGFSFTTSAYYYLFKGITQNFNSRNLKIIPKEMPLFIFSGDRDPVGDYGKGLENLEHMYKRAGLKNVVLKLYKDKRHEIFNEVNREEVIKDVAEFISLNLPHKI